MSQVERRTFLDIMGTLPSGVTVVTTLDGDGSPHGLTVSAVCSVSAEPPMLLVCIDARSRTLSALRASGRFAVNFLRGDREEVARRFSSPVSDRFEGIEWRASPLGTPVLFADSLSYADCRIVEDIVAGDHVILIGLAEGGSPPPPQSTPLGYFRRHYSAVPAGPAPDAPAPDAADPAAPGERRIAGGVSSASALAASTNPTGRARAD